MKKETFVLHHNMFTSAQVFDRFVKTFLGISGNCLWTVERIEFYFDRDKCLNAGAFSANGDLIGQVHITGHIFSKIEKGYE